MNTRRIRIANFTLLSLTLFYLIMLGGGNYEQLNVTSVVASAPPKSLAMIQGPYGFSPIAFWATFRPLTIFLFILALLFNWNISPDRKKLLIIAFLIDIAVTIATFSYFAPETGVFAAAPFDENRIDASLQARAQQWQTYNWVRLGAFYIAAVMLLLAVSKPPQRIELVERV